MLFKRTNAREQDQEQEQEPARLSRRRKNRRAREAPLAAPRRPRPTVRRAQSERSLSWLACARGEGGDLLAPHDEVEPLGAVLLHPLDRADGRSDVEVDGFNVPVERLWEYPRPSGLHI